MLKFLNFYILIKFISPSCYNWLKKHSFFRRICRLFRYNILGKFYTVFSMKAKGRKKFICTLPWEKAAIKANGEVTCSTAHRGRKELFFGNINESSFKDIWHGTKFQALRQHILDPETELSYLCYTCPYKTEYKDIQMLPLKPDYPKEVWIESTDMCNLKCSVCLHPGDRHGFYLSLERFTQFIDEVGPNLETLLFYIDGENYMHPEATEMTRYAKKVNPDLFILTSTNGLLFNTSSKQEDFVRSGVDRVIFSIDGATRDSYAHYRKGGQLDSVLDNLKAVIDFKKKLGISLHVQWRYILFEWNDSDEEMDLARELASNIGVDSLTWLITTTVNHSKRFFLSHIAEYPVKLSIECYEATEVAVKEDLLKQKFV